MNSFINSLIYRSTEPVRSIQPRLRGKFENDFNSSDHFAKSDKNSFDTAETNIDEFPAPRITTAVHASLFKNINADTAKDKPAENVVGKNLTNSAALRSMPAIIHYVKDEIKPNRPPRFEPSFKLVTPQDMPEQTSNERKSLKEDNDNTYRNTIRPVDEVKFPKDFGGVYQKKQATKEQTLPTPTVPIIFPASKEMYKPLTFIKAAPHYATPAEEPHTSHLKQKVASILYQKSTGQYNQTFNISIGRVEVRVSQPSVQLPIKPKNEGIPIMSLDDYLQKRNQGCK